jgi:hypothetical protein
MTALGQLRNVISTSWIIINVAASMALILLVMVPEPDANMVLVTVMALSTLFTHRRLRNLLAMISLRD